MKILKRIIIATYLVATWHNGSILAQQNSALPDPYAAIRYSAAFDQTALYEKYRPLIEKLGCAQNVFGKQYYDSQDYDSQENVDYTVTVEEFAQFQQECLNLLNNARKITLAQPAIGALTDMASTGIVTAAIMALFKDSVAGGFAGTNAMYTAFYGLISSLKSGYNLVSWPDNALAELEEYFAKNKCFIPQSLWPKIVKEFMAARQNQFTPEKHQHFLEFALSFTIYKPKPQLDCKDDMSIQKVKDELNQRIDQFFHNYNEKNDISYIKINVAKFVDTLLVDNAVTKARQAPRYLYLYGSGGIGKTHFVQTLSDWIQELIPGSVQFEDLVINSFDDLEGSPDAPGAFLNVLRNQLLQNKRGSVVMIDEATWLNSGSMISAAKRIFNGDRSKLVTSYFGSNMDGTGVSLSIPPMLIFVASNEPISDPALESRFDIVHYPMPTTHALVEHAYTTAQNSAVLQDRGHTIHKDAIAQWIAHLDPKNKNFRYVAGNVESFVLSA